MTLVNIALQSIFAWSPDWIYRDETCAGTPLLLAVKLRPGSAVHLKSVASLRFCSTQERPTAPHIRLRNEDRMLQPASRQPRNEPVHGIQPMRRDGHETSNRDDGKAGHDHHRLCGLKTCPGYLGCDTNRTAHPCTSLAVDPSAGLQAAYKIVARRREAHQSVIGIYAVRRT